MTKGLPLLFLSSFLCLYWGGEETGEQKLGCGAAVKQIPNDVSLTHRHSLDKKTAPEASSPRHLRAHSPLLVSVHRQSRFSRKKLGLCALEGCGENALWKQT